MGIFDHLFGTEDPETDPEYFVPTDSIGLQTTTASSIWWTKSVTITTTVSTTAMPENILLFVAIAVAIFLLVVLVFFLWYCRACRCCKRSVSEVTQGNAAESERRSDVVVNMSQLSQVVNNNADQQQRSKSE